MTTETPPTDPAPSTGANATKPVFRIRTIQPEDRPGWDRLWQGYLEFGDRTDLEQTITDATWGKILSPTRPVFCCVAEGIDGQLMGFAICVVHEATWHIHPVCYLEDLFVDPDARGHGVAKGLIDHLIKVCKRQGWKVLYLHTQADNATARKLYDHYVLADEFVRYRMRL